MRQFPPMSHKLSPMRTFEPQKASKLEMQLLVMAQRRKWFSMPRPMFELAVNGYGLPPASAAQAAWFLMAARRQFAASPGKAAISQTNFYGVLKSAFPREAFDPARAARLELAAWVAPQVDPIAAWFAELYAMPEERIREAAFYRADAMRHFARWEKEGARTESAILKQMEAELFKAWAALRAAVAE